jgi:outer membrane protein OmpA-like peptidoglycan-associated protein
MHGHLRSGRLRSGLVSLIALATACSTAVEPVVVTTVASTTTTSEAREGQAFELLAVAAHPNGAQLRVDRIEVLTDSIVVSAYLTNGSPFGLSVGNGRTVLRAETGEQAELLDPLPPTQIGPSEDEAFTLRFGPLTTPQAVTLVFNSGGGASPAGTTTTSPSFQVGPIALDPDGTRPALPDPVPIDRAVVDTAGIEVRIEGVNFAENRIGVRLRLSNPSTFEARIAPTLAPSVIVDDLGNRYPLVMPEGESFLAVAAASAGAGTLSFAGRIHPSASTFSIGINVGAESRVDRGRIYPEVVVRDISLAGDTVLAALPDAVDESASMSHPAGVRVDVLGVSFTDTGIDVPVVVSNGRSESVALALSSTFVEDDVANPYPLIPLAGNPQLVIDANTTVEATLAFSGRMADSATSIQVVFNLSGSAVDTETREPSFVFGPYQLERSAAAPAPVEAQVFLVAARSSMAPAELATSQIDQISQTLEEFDATAVDGGFQLTLPDSILFDFGSTELRSDARQALTLIADVLRYFDDAAVIVVGHTDSIGSATANQRLSELRAQEVVDALVGEHGIDGGRLSAEGRGATEPVAPNANDDGSDNPEGRQLNRRVELVVLTDEPVPLPSR